MEYFFHYLFPTLFLAVGLSRLSISYGIRDLQRIRSTTKNREACKDAILQRLVSDGYQVQESEKRLNFSKGKKYSIMVQFHDNKGKKVGYSITASPKSLKEAKALLPALEGEPESTLSYRLTRKELVPVVVTSFGVLLLLSAIRTPVVSTPSYSTPPPSSTRTTNTTPPPAVYTGPKLEVQNWEWYEQYSYLHAEGAVKNLTGAPMENVMAVVSYYDDQDNFVTSDDAMIDYDPILPGQVSPFEVMTRNNPAIKTGRLEFKVLFGGTIPHREK